MTIWEPRVLHLLGRIPFVDPAGTGRNPGQTTLDQPPRTSGGPYPIISSDAQVTAPSCLSHLLHAFVPAWQTQENGPLGRHAHTDSHPERRDPGSGLLVEGLGVDGDQGLTFNTVAGQLRWLFLSPPHSRTINSVPCVMLLQLIVHSHKSHPKHVVDHVERA